MILIDLKHAADEPPIVESADSMWPRELPRCASVPEAIQWLSAKADEMSAAAHRANAHGNVERLIELYTASRWLNLACCLMLRAEGEALRKPLADPPSQDGPF